MICATFLEQIRDRLRELAGRARLDGSVLNEEQLNWAPGRDLWSIGQIYEHVNISNALYFLPLERAIEEAKFGRENAEVRHTLLGSMLIRAAGPGGNAPAPKKLIPGAGPFSAEVAQRFALDHERLAELVGRCESTDLSQTKIVNPTVGLFKMNLADCFELVAAHGERHAGQIEQIQRRADFPR